MRFSYDEADKYGSQSSGGSYFKIENDREIKKVRLLGRDMNDFPGYACHEIEVDGKRRLVNCLREYGDPIDTCPFCAEKKKVLAKVFIPLYNIEDDEIQMWERGKAFYPELNGYVSRHPNVVSYITEVERNGKPKDTNTTYKLYEAMDQGDEQVTYEDFDGEIPEILGRYILDKSADDMEYFLQYREFPEEDEAPVRRRESQHDRNEETPRRGRRGRRAADSEEPF